MEPAQSGLQRVMRKLLAEMPAEEAVVQAWPLVCGSQVAARTEALGLVEGVLRVRVPDHEWLANLRELAGKYLGLLRAHCGDVVKRIEFVLPEVPPSGGAPGQVEPGMNWIRSRR